MKLSFLTILASLGLMLTTVWGLDDEDSFGNGVRSTSSLTASQAGRFNGFSNTGFRNPAFLRAQNFGMGATDSLTNSGLQSGSLGLQSGLLGTQAQNNQLLLSGMSGLGGLNSGLGLQSGLLGSQLQGNQMLLSGGQFGSGLDGFGAQNSFGVQGLGGLNSGLGFQNQNRFPGSSLSSFGNNGMGFNSQFNNPLLGQGLGSSSLLGLQQSGLGLNNGQFGSLGLNNGQFSSLGNNNGQFGGLGLNNGQFGGLGLNNGQFSNLGLNNGQLGGLGLNNGQFSSLGLNNGQFGSFGLSNGQFSGLGLNNGQFSGLGNNGQFGNLGLNNGLFSNQGGNNAQFGLNNGQFGSLGGVSNSPFNQQSMLLNQNSNLGLGLNSNLGMGGFGSNNFGLGALGTNSVRQFRELDSSKNDRTIFNNDIDENSALSRQKNMSDMLAVNLNNPFRQPMFPSNNMNNREANQFLTQLNANQQFASQGPFPSQQQKINNNKVNDIRTLVPGQPNQDYPTLHSVPETGFSCQGRQAGYYADLKTRCQAFHICGMDATGGTSKNSFLCPNGTLFNQVNRVCQWWGEVECSKSDQFYNLNDNDAKSHMTTLTPVQTLPSPNQNFQALPTQFPSSFDGSLFQRPFTNYDASSIQHAMNPNNHNGDQMNIQNDKPLFTPPQKRPQFRPNFRPNSSTTV